MESELDIEDLEIEVDREPAVYEIGDQVVYPHHGAGKVLKKEMKEVLGEKREYLTIKILHNDMTVMVPCCNADKAGLRRVIGEDDVKKVLSILRDDVSQMPKNWNRRFKHNREKIKTGDVFELAEVVRNLAIREQEKGLSTGEKQMYTRAKKILASELMYVLDMEEDEAESHLEELDRRRPHESQRRGRDRVGDRGAPANHQRGSGGVSPRITPSVRRRDRSRRRQRRTPWRRPAQGVRRLCRPSADRVEPRGARGGLRPRRRRGSARVAARRLGRGRPVALGLRAQRAGRGAGGHARRSCTTRPDRWSRASWSRRAWAP